ncbi:transketolase [uncultured Ruthenibacterium sp.]|uniref:transketolase n=1 Tax=uncultured Ruthenibacterium sp. TaxID=1905347 RepID=UPI00349E6D3D
MERLTQNEVQYLNDKAYEIREKTINIVAAANWGHIGGSFSIAEILACLYFRHMRVDPSNPMWDKRDYLVLSKAHCSPALYSALSMKGFFPFEDTFTYTKVNGLPSHLDIHCTPGVECSGGSLGLGLSYSVGIACGLRLKEGDSQRVYCIVGDGEIAEGQFWEAAMSAGQFKLSNLILFIDANRVQAKSFVHEAMPQEPIADRMRAFGWHVIEVDGHDVVEVSNAIYCAKYVDVYGKPICIVAKTCKGKGIDECEFNHAWHSKPLPKEKAEELLEALAKRYGKQSNGVLHIEPKTDNGSLKAVWEV